MLDKGKIIKQMIIWLAIVLFSVWGVFFFLHFRNEKRLLGQIEEYIYEFSSRTAEHVEDVFEDKKSAIASIACLYGEAINFNEKDLSLLAEIEKESGFDWIRFVDADGYDYSSDGRTANVSDREYFKMGMEGKTGTDFVSASRINGERFIGFYSPVYNDTEICGIMVGFLNEHTVSEILTAKLYGYAADTMILNSKAEVLGRYTDCDSLKVNNFNDCINVVDENRRQQTISAIAQNESLCFGYTEAGVGSLGYIMPIPNSDWSIVQFFPYEAKAMLLDDVDYDGKLIIALFASFVFVIGVIGIWIFNHIRDITNQVREQQEKEIREAERSKQYDIILSLSKIYSSVYYIDVIHDTFEQIFTVVPTIEKLVGRSGKASDTFEFFSKKLCQPEYREMLKEFTDMKTLEDRLSDRMIISAEFQGNFRKEKGVDLKTWGRCSFIVAKRDEDGFLTHVIFATEYIHEQKIKEIEQNENLRQALNEAESANRAKTAFLSNMSHDIRTPMNAVLGFADLAKKNIDNSEKVMDYLNKIQQSGNCLQELLDNVLQISRIERGKYELEEQIYDIEEVNASVFDNLEDALNKKSLTLNKSVNVIHRNLYVDVTKMRQVLMNLLSNAIKYTPENGTISFTNNELESDKDGYCIIETIIEDNGIGISKEFMPHLFDRFERERNTTEIAVEGTGLGMAIVKEVINLMEGTISVESSEGEGTKITIRIEHKIADSFDLYNRGEVTETTEDESRFVGYRLLLVEDNQLNAEIATEILTEYGFLVEHVPDGIDAIRKLDTVTASYYDAILMDIQMPIMNGYKTTEAIRHIADECKSHIPIIAMTANAFEEDRKRALESGMDDFISKPVDIKKLIEVLRRILK